LRKSGYDLEGNTDLVSGFWTPIPGATNIPGTDATAGHTNAGGQAFHFFRTRIRLE